MFAGKNEIELFGSSLPILSSTCFIINWRTRPNENDLSNHSRCSFIPFPFIFSSSTNGDKNHVTYTNAFIATASHSFSYFTCFAILQWENGIAFGAYYIRWFKTNRFWWKGKWRILLLYNRKTSQLKWIHSQWMVNGEWSQQTLALTLSMAYYSFFIFLTSMQMRDKIVKNACNKEILRYNNKLKSTEYQVPCYMWKWKYELNQCSILSMICRIFSYIHQSWKPEAVITLKIYIFQISFPFSDWECLPRHFERCFSNMSEIHRSNTKSGELMNRKNVMSFHPSIADHIIWNDHINSSWIEKKKTRHKQKSRVFPKRLSTPSEIIFEIE